MNPVQTTLSLSVTYAEHLQTPHNQKYGHVKSNSWHHTQEEEPVLWNATSTEMSSEQPPANASYYYSSLK